MTLDISSKTIQLRDNRIVGYAEYGEPKGHPVFYFHGWPGSRLSGQEMDAAAKKHKIRIISPDRPGYGLSDFQKDRTLLDYPNDVAEIADILGIQKFALIGVSGGGPYAAACAYRLQARVTKVAIVVGLSPIYKHGKNIPGILEGMALQGKIGWTNFHRFPWLRDLGCSIHFIQKKYIKNSLFNFIAFPSKPDKELFTTHSKTRFRLIGEQAFKQGIRGPSLDLKIYTDDWGFKLKDIKAKVFLWYGAEDKNVGVAMGRYYQSNLPKNELTISPKEGHLGRMNHAEEILKNLY